MFAIFEKLRRRRKKSSKRLSFKSTEVQKDRISKRERTKETKKTCKNEIENRVSGCKRTKEENGRNRFPTESTGIKNRIAEREEAKDTQAYKERYLLTNKNLSIITDDESDSSTGRAFVAIKSRERSSLDEYVIVGVEEKPVTLSKESANDNSDSESVKTRTESGSNCCPKCGNNTWYAVFKRKVLRTNKISPCVITGLEHGCDLCIEDEDSPFVTTTQKGWSKRSRSSDGHRLYPPITDNEAQRNRRM